MKGIRSRTIQRTYTQQAEADHAAETGDAVDPIHEIVEIGRPDDEEEDRRQHQQEQKRVSAERRLGKMGAQTGQQRENQDEGREDLDDEPESDRDPEIIGITADSGDQDRGKQKGGRNSQRQAREDKCRQDADAGAAGSRNTVGAALVRDIQQPFAEGRAGDKPGSQRSQRRAHQEKQDCPVVGNQFHRSNKECRQVLDHISPELRISSTVSRHPAIRSYRGTKPILD